MKSSKGITLTSLAITIVLTLILATIVIKTSIHSLKTMQLENFKSQIEEVQRKVDEISSSYDNYKKVNVDASYKEYFESKFGSSPGFLKDNEGLAKELLETKENLNNNKESELIFYFKENDVKKYLGLKGIKDIIVDFSTRYIYSVKGITDPEDKSKIYYCAQDLGVEIVVEEKEVAIDDEIKVIASVDPIKVGNVSFYPITLKVKNKTNEEKNYQLSKVYYSKKTETGDVGEAWVEVKEVEKEGNKINFKLYDSGKYKFKVVDVNGIFNLSNNINVYTNFPENTKENPEDVGLQVALKKGWENDTVKYINTKEGLEVTNIAQVASVYGVSVGNGETVPVPKGFYYVGGNLDTGVIISDSEDDMYDGVEDKTTYKYTRNLVGNQFVWIPCEASKYVKTTWAKSEGTSFDPYTPQGESTTVKRYGGFYIARYEAGAPINTKAHTEWVQNANTIYNFVGIPQSKAGVILWMCIDRYNAKQSAEKMYNTEYVNSGLITGTQWDITLNTIVEKTSLTINDMNTGTWGNFINTACVYNGRVINYSNGWISPYGEETENGSMVANTAYYTTPGAVEIAEKYHIFDLAGNLWEWTEEMYIGASRMVVYQRW